MYNGESAKKIDSLKKEHLRVPFPGGESLEQAIARFQLFYEEYSDEFNQGNVMIIGHRASYYALEYLYHHVSLQRLTSEPWSWQPGWHYTR